jgi:hypothetical protein
MAWLAWCTMLTCFDGIFIAVLVLLARWRLAIMVPATVLGSF